MPADWKTVSFARTAAVLPLAMLLASPAISGDWSGFFLAPSIDNTASGEATVETEGGARNVQLGYNQDFGIVVLGGEVSLREAVGSTDDGSQRVKLRAGYDFGPALGYVTLGNIQANGGGAASGSVVGIGMTYSLNQALQLSGELLRNEAVVQSPGGLPRGETLAVQAAFRF